MKKRIPKKTTYHRKARQVMEKHTGRKLFLGEVVHHENGDITNNDIKNLRLFENNVKHMEYHKKIGSPNRTDGRIPALLSRITELRKQGKSWRDIARIVGVSKSTIHRWKKKDNVPFLSSGASQTSNISETKFEIHDYQVTFRILEKPYTWRPNAILKLRRMDFESIPRNGWEEYFFKFNDCSVHLTPYTVMIFPPRTKSKLSIIDAKLIATQTALDLIPSLEKKLEIKLSNRPCTFITIPRQHSAMLNDKVWNTLKAAGFEQVKDDKGRIRLKLDESQGKWKHMESEHPQDGEEDINRFNNLTKETQLDNLIKETVIGGCSFYKTNKALVTTQQAILSMHERLTKIEQEKIPPVEDGKEKYPSYIG